ncbi:alpha/beta hydrolase-like protein [Lentithecium fluviatile CBS 122367]|uniref:Alpha/beta hydrolase-like protein n=1 Tax=Lentithecium fluviatile CBS 122367 TaxID=1168545 RepID=A0A6G1J445_9PLEO|nr:alpha/beta hydrolase-like protein [Lentithecium fluviatile CBS 122367]
MSDMKYFTSNDGYQLAYQDVGSPFLPPLILLHGFTGSSQYWKHNIPRLSQTYHALAPDLRGHGDSAKTAHGFHVSRLAMDLHNFLCHLGLENEKGGVRCIAGSLGCAILWCYAELFTPDVFSHMVWVDQSPMQNYSLDGVQSWGPKLGNRGMNSEAAVKQLFHDLATNPDDVYRGTIAACLSYRSHPLPEDHLAARRKEEDETFFLGEARKGDPLWYAQLMKDHTALDWRQTIVECFGGRKENKTKLLVVASSRSGCFHTEGPMSAVQMVNEKVEHGSERAMGLVVDWGGHWCFWEKPERFCEVVEPFLQTRGI